MNPFDELIGRYPCLAACRDDIAAAGEALIAGFEAGGKLLVCGNGGSCADAEHIVGELMKGFLKKRPLPAREREAMQAACPSLPGTVLNRLQGALPAVALTGSPALSTAFANDVDPALIFAQQVYGLGRPGDVFLGISTSGNAANVLAAAQTAKALGLTVLALTGRDGGRLKECADVAIVAPETETYRIQELHLPVYHALCAAAEAHFFEE
jgi:hypothetical protein